MAKNNKKLYKIYLIERHLQEKDLFKMKNIKYF